MSSGVSGTARTPPLRSHQIYALCDLLKVWIGHHMMSRGGERVGFGMRVCVGGAWPRRFSRSTPPHACADPRHTSFGELVEPTRLVYLTAWHGGSKPRPHYQTRCRAARHESKVRNLFAIWPIRNGQPTTGQRVDVSSDAFIVLDTRSQTRPTNMKGDDSPRIAFMRHPPTLFRLLYKQSDTLAHSLYVLRSTPSHWEGATWGVGDEPECVAPRAPSSSLRVP